MAYADDAEISQDTDFMRWIAALENIVREWGAKHLGGETPYDLPLADSTGLRCWYDSYKDGMTPQEAFDSDRSYWE